MSATLADALAGDIPLIADVCATDPRATSLINQAQRMIIRRGKFWGLYQKIRICLTDVGCITWPRQVAAIENVAIDGEPVPVRNEWYEFLWYGPGLMPKRSTSCSSCAEDYCWCTTELYDRGMAPMFNDIRPPNKKLRLYPGAGTDVGKRVLIKGHDSNSIWIRTVESGVYIDGFYMTLASPFVDSPMELRDITSVQKPLTDERLLAFEVDSVTGIQRQLADYESDELTPSYRRSLVYGLPGTSTCRKTVTAMAKLEFIPAVNPTDILIVGNLDALEFMVQSILKRQKNLEAEAISLERAALRELNQELDHRNGKDKTAISLHVHGSARLSNKRIGSLL